MRQFLDPDRLAFRTIDKEQSRPVPVAGDFLAIQNHPLDRFPAAVATGVAACDADGNALKRLKVPGRVEDGATGLEPPAGAFAFIGTIIEANMKSGHARRRRKIAHVRGGRWLESNRNAGSVKKPDATIQNLST
jgi:hypothetical protein